MLAGEVLVEAAQRLPRTVDDLLDGELLAGLGAGQQLEAGVEEALHPALAPQPGRVERPGHGEVPPAHRCVGGVAGAAVGSRLTSRQRIPRCPISESSDSPQACRAVGRNSAMRRLSAPVGRHRRGASAGRSVARPIAVSENAVIVPRSPGVGTDARARRGGPTMDQAQIADIIEIEQLLARYAIGMTQDDIEAVMDVFTPDGTYSAFGATYTLARLPGPGGGRAEGPLPHRHPGRSSSTETPGPGTRRCASSSRPPTTCASAGTRDTYRRTEHGLAAADPGHDVPARAAAPATRARPHDPTRPAARPADAGRLRGPPMELDDFKVAVDDWLDEHEARARAARSSGIGTLGRADGPAATRCMRLTFDAGFMRMGWPERVGGLGGSNLLRAYLGEALTARDLVEPGIYSMPEVLAPTMIDYAPAGAGGRHGAAAPAGRRDLVPGLLGTGHREQPGLAQPAGPRAPTTAGGSTARRSGRAWRSTPSAACS